MKITIQHSKELMGVRAIFADAGFDLFVVGGACRDTLMGIAPKDIDLTTSATPDEQIALYRENDIHFIPTGLQHGTISIVLNGEVYEITTFRTESDHDGRHATVSYTRDIIADISRRDLTINSIAADFDGNIIDPFGGVDDIKNRRVRFVGNTEERMHEDYLRILRFFRFHGRISDGNLDQDAVEAIERTRDGLSGISPERIWMEMSKIITGPRADYVVWSMRELGLFDIIGMPRGDMRVFLNARVKGISNPASVMGMFATVGEIDRVADAWKWSTEERDRARFIAEHKVGTDMKRWKEMLVDGVSFDWVADLMRIDHVEPTLLSNWVIPKLPVNGSDLIKAGMKPSPEMGATLKKMMRAWKDSDYTMTKDQLMDSSP